MDADKKLARVRARLRRVFEGKERVASVYANKMMHPTNMYVRDLEDLAQSVLNAEPVPLTVAGGANNGPR
jgi:division protein CdvB (Snf7/Vps24/ESCRT-III family)